MNRKEVETLKAQVKKQVETALRAGYGIAGDIRIEPVVPGDTGRYEVWVREKWFGVWDVERETFVE